VLGLVLLGAAVLTAQADDGAKSGPKVGNYYRASARLAEDVQRVLVLPLVPWGSAADGTARRPRRHPAGLTADARRVELAAGCEALETVLQAELVKTRKFEIVRITPDALRVQTGRASWSAEDPLPPKFFETLREAQGCDAVLFCQLTVFKAYAPMSVGWRLRLVDCRSQQTLWATDEVFDAAQREVQDEARHFGQKESWLMPWHKADDWLVLRSPRRFGQFTLVTVLATLPRR
jgi:hypothetical protein